MKENDGFIYRLAVEKWGAMSQVLQAMEELSELSTALSKYINGRGEVEDVVDEIADVEIMMQQLRHIFPEETINNRKKQKKERLERLVYGRYSN